jgi:hypothetical protein
LDCAASQAVAVKQFAVYFIELSTVIKLVTLRAISAEDGVRVGHNKREEKAEEMSLDDIDACDDGAEQEQDLSNYGSDLSWLRSQGVYIAGSSSVVQPPLMRCRRPEVTRRYKGVCLIL